ncbi:Ribosomal L25-like protein [Plasmodium coatneyi]|uniref:Ribosomal L25-like protein n=1 Tax=Plasmodium coatneyi TaxID=208452 RepID=A0A1B1DUC1_9APIC|nr:Ribosomal L25-like protein [Plasmodium coatneyi]ANQ06175.1 Ribosomal L25-like protein [Plasmodium coatneyi]
MNKLKLISKPTFFMHNAKRNHLNYKLYLKYKQWDFLKKEIVDYFNSHSRVSTVVDVQGRCWEKFKKKELLQVHGYIPAIIWKYGPEQRICIDHKLIDEYAFEEEDGHLSLLFSARLFRIHIDGNVVECVVSHVETDPVEKHIYFLKFARVVKNQVTELNIPCSIVGLIGCPAYVNGYHVQLAMNYIKCKVIGNNIPPPFQIDVSKLTYREPYNSIKLGELKHLLPDDGNVVFSEEYDLNETEVVWTYEPGKIPETPLPEDYMDPNFINKKGKRIQLTYKDYWPKQ